MYYLRKEPELKKISEIVKTDGTVIPPREYISEDRALFSNGNRYYRREYPCTQKGFRLYQVKKLSTIKKQRDRLFEYCGEWFYIYDENGKTDL